MGCIKRLSLLVTNALQAYCSAIWSRRVNFGVCLPGVEIAAVEIAPADIVVVDRVAVGMPADFKVCLWLDFLAGDLSVIVDFRISASSRVIRNCLLAESTGISNNNLIDCLVVGDLSVIV